MNSNDHKQIISYQHFNEYVHNNHHKKICAAIMITNIVPVSPRIVSIIMITALIITIISITMLMTLITFIVLIVLTVLIALTATNRVPCFQYLMLDLAILKTAIYFFSRLFAKSNRHKFFNQSVDICSKFHL